MARTAQLSKSVEFRLHAPSAKKVSVVGNFNKWNTKVTLAKKDSKGNWILKKKLKPGNYEYKFYVDGNWMDDPNCNSRIFNTFGSQNCLLVVK